MLSHTIRHEIYQREDIILKVGQGQLLHASSKILLWCTRVGHNRTMNFTSCNLIRHFQTRFGPLIWTQLDNEKVFQFMDGFTHLLELNQTFLDAIWTVHMDKISTMHSLTALDTRLDKTGRVWTHIWTPPYVLDISGHSHLSTSIHILTRGAIRQETIRFSFLRR